LVELLIFVVELLDLFANLRGFLLRAAHGHHAVRPENILEQEQEEAENKNCARVGFGEFAKPREIAY
jgi:hypothetical protein